MPRPVGWKNEPARHSLASKGVKTRRSDLTPHTLTDIGLAARHGDGEVKVAVYDFKTHGWHYVIAKPDEVAKLTMVIEYEEQPSGYWKQHRKQDIFVLLKDLDDHQVEDWLGEHIDEDREEIFHHHAEIRFTVRGRVTKSWIEPVTGLPSSNVIAAVDTVAGE